MLCSDTSPYKNTTTSRECKAGIDSDMILPLLEKENEDSIVTGGTESDETVSGIEESGSSGGGGGGGGGDYDDEGNIVQATQQTARPNLRNLK